jgi:AcrR family transcriptional regulator
MSNATKVADGDLARLAPGRDRTNVRGEATREQILLTAERLFAERGIQAVPLRDIGLAADQKNKFAVQYHFGNRDNLVRAIAEYRARTLIDSYDQLIADLVTAGSPPSVIDWVRALVKALAVNLADESHFLPFVSRYIIERGGYAGLDETMPKGSISTLMVLAQRLLPDLTVELLFERWEILFTSAVHALARYQIAHKSGQLRAPLDYLLEDLVRTLAAGLQVPPPGDEPELGRGVLRSAISNSRRANLRW